MARSAPWAMRGAGAQATRTPCFSTRGSAVAPGVIGWLFVNLDTAGWILLVLTVRLMTWELTTRKGGKGGGRGQGRSFGRPDEPS